MQELKANTGVDVRMGPFVDVGDGFTPQTDIGNPNTNLTGVDEAELLKHNGAGTVDITARTWAAVTDCDGWYDLTLTTDDTNTEGLLDIVIQDDSDCLPVHKQFMVLSQAAYDSKYAAKDDGFMNVNVKTIGRTDTQETEANNLESACANYSVTRGLTGTALPAVAADGVGGLPISDAGELDLDTLLGTLTTLAAETRSANVLDQLKTIIAVIESQRGAHTHQPGTGSILFIDATNGATHAGGNRGGISDPYLTFADAQTNAGTDFGHDLYIMVAGAAGASTHQENITVTKGYSFIRGPGRDLTWKPATNNSSVAITVEGDGCELCGFQLDSYDGTGTANGIVGTSADFIRICKLWINQTRGDGIELTDCDNFVITDNNLQGTGTGAGHGIQILAGNGETGNYGIITYNSLNDVAGDAIQIDTTGGGTVDAVQICFNMIQGATDDGIDIVDSGCVDTIIFSNIIGNNTSNNIEDAGTTTLNVNNVPWLYSTVEGRSLDVTSTGAAGIDWANVENPTTALDLTQTDIQLCDTTTTNSDMRGTNSAALATGLATHDGKLDTVDTVVDAVKVVTDALTAAAAAKLATSAGTIVTGAAEAGTLSTTKMTTDLSEATNDHYNGRIIIWTSGVLQNQGTAITDYAGATGLLTFTAVTEAPSAADTFIIV